MSFEEIPHTADVRFRVRAPTLAGIFSETVSALMQVMYGPDRKADVERTVSLDADDRESLLRDFLSELLFISDTEGLVVSTASVRTDGQHLTATLSGESFDPKRHSGGTEVKGISYSGLCITRDANGYMLNIVFDV
ncbi:MAG: archease [Methanoregula sp.]|nr:archease [Methanoregula sp.]